VLGATSTKYDARRIDPVTGAPDDGGVVLRPADVHATVLEAMGLDRSHLANQNPNVIEAMLVG
jgi:hypothetical protein